MDNPNLLCTVGGVHRPILRAIESTSPRYVCFFCTDRDPGTGRPGSIVQVTGKGKNGPERKQQTSDLREGACSRNVSIAGEREEHAMQEMTIGEIESSFDSEWVLVGDPVTDEALNVLRGKVLHHSKDRDEVYRRGLELRPKRVAILYLPVA